VDSTTSPATSNYGVDYPTGTTIPVRGDFDTLDNPFYYPSDPAVLHTTHRQNYLVPPRRRRSFPLAEFLV